MASRKSSSRRSRPARSRGRYGNAKPPTLPKIITHKNMGPLLDAISAEPYFSPGPVRQHLRPEWVYRQVVLEFPTGELARNGLNTLALVGMAGRTGQYETTALTGHEGFDAQGLEGKVRVRKPLFNALMNLRDLIPRRRGRIVVER
jgi:hypothetical protein